MDNQHRKISGYRELDALEIEDINAVKKVGETIGSVVHRLSGSSANDQRWVSIGKTFLQLGLMALTRAVAKPDSF